MLVGDRREQHGTVRHSRQGLAQRRREFVEHAGAQHEPNDWRRKRGQPLAKVVRQDGRGRGEDAAG